ncbi:agmatinase [Arhodomonas sp. AD133]|uniref:agmatinase n=1 Tax=Arhodomonas sp. AD133 TaxID=3415009 RepID=UPI003EBB72C7
MHSGDQAFRKASLYGRAADMTYGGALSYLRRKYTRDLTGVDVAVTGIPFDNATSNRPGARFGPRAVREASTQLAELPAFPWGFDPFRYLAVSDYGDCFLDFGHPETVVEAVQDHAAGILAGGASMLTFGGDHFVTYPLLRAHVDVHGPLSLIHFDAHPDTWPDEPGRLDHGSMFTRAVKEGLVDPERSVQIGIRTHSQPRGFTVLDAPWVHANGPQAVIETIADVVGDHKAYLTFDIDCLDPAYAPGTGTPVAGGLTSAQALAILRGLGDRNLVGMDVVEVAPAYDHAEITAIAAATLGHDYLCLLADRRRAAGETPKG